ncbi:MAG: hypothetical protein AAFR64_12805 [Pseudomonadota bacterium]
MSEAPVKAPQNRFGCIDCELPTYQDDALFWLAIVAPFVLTIITGIILVLRAEKPLGVLQLMAISVPGGLPPAMGVALSIDGSIADKVGFALLLVFIWASTFGPLMVFFTQWIYVNYRAMRKSFEK